MDAACACLGWRLLDDGSRGLWWWRWRRRRQHTAACADDHGPAGGKHRHRRPDGDPEREHGRQQRAQLPMAVERSADPGRHGRQLHHAPLALQRDGLPVQRGGQQRRRQRDEPGGEHQYHAGGAQHRLTAGQRQFS